MSTFEYDPKEQSHKIRLSSKSLNSHQYLPISKGNYDKIRDILYIYDVFLNSLIAWRECVRGQFNNGSIFHTVTIIPLCLSSRATWPLNSCFQEVTDVIA